MMISNVLQLMDRRLLIYVGANYICNMMIIHSACFVATYICTIGLLQHAGMHTYQILQHIM